MKYHDQLLLQYTEMTAYRQEHYATIVEIIQMLMARTMEATINNYKAHCRVAPANEAPISKTIKQRERRIEPLDYPALNTKGIRLAFLPLDDKGLTTKWKHHIRAIWRRGDGSYLARDATHL